MKKTKTRQNLIISLIFLLSLGACKKSDQAAPEAQSQSQINTFGLLPNRSEGVELSMDQKINLIKNQLCVPYVRAGVVLVNYDGRIADVENYQAQGIKVLLNLTSKVTSSAVAPGPYVSDLTLYRQKLSSILDKYSPTVLVVENEEANGAYYTGSAQEYLNLLDIAIEECHRRNLQVSNGGFSALMARLLVWDHYRTAGQTTKENSYIARVFPDGTTSASLQQKTTGNGQLALTFAKAKALVAAYLNRKIDLVNIHWYEPVKESDQPSLALPTINQVDLSAFEETVEVFKLMTGHKVMTNEIGQLNTQGGITTAVLQKCEELQLPYTIWYSGDGDDYGKAKALYNGDASLRPSGIAFANFIAGKF